MTHEYMKVIWWWYCFILLSSCCTCMSTIKDGNRINNNSATLDQLRRNFQEENSKRYQFWYRSNISLANHLLSIVARQNEQKLRKNQEKQKLRQNQEKQAARDELEMQIYRTHLASRFSNSAILSDFLTMRFWDYFNTI